MAGLLAGRARCVHAIINRVPSVSGSQRARCMSSTTAISEIIGQSSNTATRLIDCGNADAYNRAHIPNAVKLPFDPFLKDPRTGEVIDEDIFRQLCTVMGVSKDTHVIAYDGGSVMWAARVWWIFQYYGHKRVSVLDGCWPAYVRSGAPVSLSPVEPDFATDLPAAVAREELLATGKDVLQLVQSGPASSRPVQLLDTRSASEFSGLDMKSNMRGGHVPGAVNVPHTDMLTAQGTFKPAKEMAGVFEKAGLDLSKPTIAYCQAGIRGAMGVLALRLAGMQEGVRAANYDASMKEWLNNPNYPVDR